MSNTLAILSLKYVEPDYEQTLDCLKQTGLRVYFADRDGVGNMSRAFNEGFDKYIKGRYDYVWMVTNIIFDKRVPFLLYKAAVENDIASIHPAMKSSDHKFLHPDGSSDITEVPWIELTAPMFKSSVFDAFKLDERLPYYYMDLDVSFRLKEEGQRIAVHKGATVEHTYLRNRIQMHPVSEIRKQLRNYHTPLSRAHLIEKYGADWEALIWNKTEAV